MFRGWVRGVSPVYRFGGTRLRAALSSSEYSLSSSASVSTST